MNQSLLYIASIIAFAYATLHFLQLATIMMMSNGCDTPMLVLGLAQGLVMVAVGVLFRRRLAAIPADQRAEAFNRHEALEFLGILAIGIAIVWLGSQAQLIYRILQLRAEIDIGLIDHLGGPVSLLGVGIFAACAYRARS